MDIKTQESPSMYVVYQIYNPYTLTQMNLSICENIKISVNIPLHLDAETIALIDSLNLDGYDLFDSNNTFYNDVCTPYTTLNETDILLYDRKKYIFDVNANFSLCQTGCKYKAYNPILQRVYCECLAESQNENNLKNISFNMNDFVSSFYLTIKNSNFLVLKCIKLLFSIKGLKKNYGCYLMSIILVLYISLVISYIIIGRKTINNIINAIIKNRLNYIENQIKKQKTKHASIITNISKNNNINNNLSSQNIKRRNQKSKTSTSNKKEVIIKLNKCIQDNKKKLGKNQIVIHKYIQNDKKNRFSRNKNSPPKKMKAVKIESVQISKDKIKNNTDNSSSRKVFFSCNNLPNLNLNNQFNNEFANKQIKNKMNNKETLKNNIEIIAKIISKLPKKNLEILNLTNHNTLNDYELNTLDYSEAIKYDKRTYFQYYFGLLKLNQLIIFTFITKNDYNLKIIKIILFLLLFPLHLTLNCFFYNDSAMHKIFENNGQDILYYRIPSILYTFLINLLINFLLKALSLTAKDIIRLNKTENIKNIIKMAENIEKQYKKRSIIFFILTSILFLFFWYFICCFCAVFVNTQYCLMIDSIISFVITMVFPFFWSLIPGFFRITALNSKNKSCLYTIGNILALLS